MRAPEKGHKNLSGGLGCETRLISRTVLENAVASRHTSRNTPRNFTDYESGMRTAGGRYCGWFGGAGMGSLIKYHTTYYGRRSAAHGVDGK